MGKGKGRKGGKEKEKKPRRALEPPTPPPTPEVPLQPVQTLEEAKETESAAATATAADEGCGMGDVAEEVSSRFVWALALLVGRQVVVETRDGTLYAGVLHCAMPPGDDDTAGDDPADAGTVGGVGVVLRMAAVVGPQRVQPVPVLVIRARDFVQLTASSVDDVSTAAAPPSTAVSPAGVFATDEEISRRATSATSTVERELTPWRSGEDEESAATDPEAGHTLEELARRGDRNRQWDQFAENKRRFGVRSTYSEDLYTTPLNRDSEFYRAHAAEAEATARLIEREATSNVHLAEERGQALQTEQTEEERFSAVDRTAATTGTAPAAPGLYVPPHKRPGQSQRPRPPPVSTALQQSSDSRKAVAPHSPLSTVHSAASPPPLPPSSEVGDAQVVVSNEPPPIKLPRACVDGLFRPRSHSDTRSGLRHVAASVAAAAAAATTAAAAATTTTAAVTEDHRTPPMSPLSLLAEPQRIMKTSSLDCIQRRSPIIDFQQPLTPTGGSPRRNAALIERMRLRQAVVTERFRSSSPSPVLSPLVSDVKRLQALQLEPAAPAVSQDVLREFQTFRVARSRGSFSRESVMEDLRRFQTEYPQRQVSGRSSMRASASGNFFPSMVVHRHAGSPSSLQQTSPRQPRKQPTSPSPDSRPLSPASGSSSSPKMPLATTTTPPPPLPITAQAPRINPEAPSFNPNASTFTPKKTVRAAATTTVAPPPPPLLPRKVFAMLCNGMKAHMDGHEDPEKVTPTWPAIAGSYASRVMHSLTSPTTHQQLQQQYEEQQMQMQMPQSAPAAPQMAFPQFISMQSVPFVPPLVPQGYYNPAAPILIPAYSAPFQYQLQFQPPPNHTVAPRGSMMPRS